MCSVYQIRKNKQKQIKEINTEVHEKANNDTKETIHRKFCFVSKEISAENTQEEKESTNKQYYK